jgi:pyrroloquinoline quinone (PQQ) biosynthesis protein C
MPADTLPAPNPLDLTVTPAGEQQLLAAIAPLQQRLAAHPLYRSIRSLESLRTFMQSHVYAVWDFMSLLKSLQRALTSVELPWRPVGTASTRRLVNEIVLGEESDVYQDEPLSHFELYLRAMQSCGASTASVDQLLASLARGSALSEALAPAPAEAAAFVRSTFAVIATGDVHRIAAAFTFGREDLIPEMFSAFVRELDGQMPGRIAPFRYYLERHIEVDGDEHGPMALAMLRELCPTTRHWEEARVSAEAALEARLALWDSIHARLHL